MKKLTITSVAVAVLLSACGGSGNGGSSSSSNTNTNVPVTSVPVKVVGASLADSGTFGFKFTVQPKETYKVYSELVASAYRVSSICPAYGYTGSFTAKPGCTNYAVAGAKVNFADEGSPLSVVKQLQDVGNAGFAANDLLIVGEASSNDAAALATAYLTDLQYAGAGHPELATAFATLVGTLGVTGSFASPSAPGVSYMQALADKLVLAVETNALAKGATRVAIVNTLDITRTPRFEKVLADIAAANGGGASGDAARAQVRALVVGWIDAYNLSLDDNIAASPNASKIAVVDLYTEFNDRLNSPTTYALTNTSATVCDEIYTGGTAPGTTALGVDPATGQPNAVVAACVGTAAAAPSDWQSYMFADSFHPTPFGHQILSGIVVDRLTAARWM